MSDLFFKKANLTRWDQMLGKTIQREYGNLIENLAKNYNKHYCSVTISSVIPRNKMTIKLTIKLKRYYSVSPNKERNSSKLHLKLKGSAKLQYIFTESVGKMFPVRYYNSRSQLSVIGIQADVRMIVPLRLKIFKICLTKNVFPRVKISLLRKY